MDMKQMYRITTVDGLDTWADKLGLSFEKDPELMKRRLTLLADTILPHAQNREVNSCDECGKQFKHRHHLLRHGRTMHATTLKFQCQYCSLTFSRKDNLSRHLKGHINNTVPTQRKRQADHTEIENTKRRRTDSAPEKTCIWCTQKKQLLPDKPFCAECGDNGRECRWCHRPLPERFYSKRTDVCDRCINRREKYLNNQRGGGSSTQALDGVVKTITVDPQPGNIWDILQFFADNQSVIEHLVQEGLHAVKGLKWFMTLFVKFVKYNQNNEVVYAEPVFRSINFTCTNASQIEQQLSEAFQHLHNSYQNFERDGSGWSIDKIIKLELNTAEFRPLEGSSYLPLPPKIQKKKAVLNIQNDDQKCFIWSVLASLHPATRDTNANRVSHYTQYEHELNINNLDIPLPLSQISNFEKLNDISINVFGLEGNEVFPLQITDQRNMSKHINLLLFSKGEQRHYCLIRNLSRLLGDRTAHDGLTHYCNYCLHGFCRKDLLEEHIPYCSPHGPQKLSFPTSEEKQWVQFNSVNKQLKVPFVIYADFESFVKPIQSCDPDPTKSSTTAYQKHEPAGFSYMVKCTQDELSKPAQVYRGPNVIYTFFERLLEEEENICEILSQVKPMSLTTLEEKAFQEAELCHICDKALGADRVRDHDHLSGQFRGAAHNTCNLQYQFRQGKRSQTSKFYIPVIFHNLRGYDMHLLMESAGKFKNKAISCIPNNLSKFISFSLGNLRCIDSLQFLNASLDTLVSSLAKDAVDKDSNLTKDGADKFSNLIKHFPDPEQHKLLMRKGVFPYDFLSSPEVFTEATLPTKQHFYNKLNDSEVTDADYQHAQTVWQTFNMKTFAEYHDLYLKSDVLLLTDVFENFRSICLEYYHLDPAHYYTSPGLAWDAMLKMTGIQLQLIDDIDMFLMIENGIRGGVSMISKKYAQANNPKVPEYDPTKPNTWLTYLDMNNLYGVSMSDPLPEKDFEWLTPDQIDQFDVSSIADDADTGYILEVDLDYPPHLHEQHSVYPLAPETREITKDMLSPHTLQLRENLGLKGKPSKKLVPHLGPKTKYVVHYRNLKYYLSHGLRLTKVHRVIAFTQSAWLQPYINFNTQKRRVAKTTFEKDLFKLLNNAVFGKTMENMRKRVSVELVNTPKRLRKMCAKPNFQSFTIVNEDLVAVNMKKTNIVLNRPIYAGFCILDLSKVYMYQFHYDIMKADYGDKAQLLFTDTDSLCYEIETFDWYRDMFENLDRFDTSNFNEKHPLYSSTNAKVLGKMKDECGGKPIESFVGLRPKMYSLQYGYMETETDEHGNVEIVQKQGTIKRAKGVKKYVAEKQLKHDAYEQCLFEHSSMSHQMNMIRSYNHQLYSVTMSKTTLSPYDDKRYVLDSGLHTLAHGHYKTQ